MRGPFYESESNFTICKFILPVGNKIMSSKLLFASCQMLYPSYKFKEIILRVASCVLWDENFKFILRVASCFLQNEILRW